MTQVACGYKHTLALTDKGEVYAWGKNMFGQLGNGTRSSATVPIKVSQLSGFDYKAVSVVCGENASFTLDKEGNVNVTIKKQSFGPREVHRLNGNEGLF